MAKEPKNLDISTLETVERPAEIEKETGGKTLGLLMDVELELSAILGSCDMSVKKVLELTKGSIIELENKTSEPIDLLVNGKPIGKGEVVIIEDNFGLRITDTIDGGLSVNEWRFCIGWKIYSGAYF